MRMSVVGLLLFVSMLSTVPLCAAEKDKHIGKLGDLLLTVVGIEKKAPQDNRYSLLVMVKVTNVGKHPVCDNVIPTLKATYDLEYKRTLHRSNDPHIHELLPGEETKGT